MVLEDVLVCPGVLRRIANTGAPLSASVYDAQPVMRGPPTVLAMVGSFSSAMRLRSWM